MFGGGGVVLAVTGTEAARGWPPRRVRRRKFVVFEGRRWLASVSEAASTAGRAGGWGRAATPLQWASHRHHGVVRW